MDTDEFDIVVVDNDSSDGSVGRILSWCHRPVPPPEGDQRPAVVYATRAGLLRVPAQLLEPSSRLPPATHRGVRLFVVPAGHNRGFAAGNNLGLRAAEQQAYTHFWLLNTDTVVQRQALPALLRRAADDPSIGMVGSTLLYFETPDRVQALGGAWLDPRRMLTAHIGIGEPAAQVPSHPGAVEARMAYVVGASMLVSADFVREVGLMQEDYFLYFEELDWAQRASGRFRLGYAPDSRVYHRVGTSSAQPASDLAETLLAQNRIRILGRFFRAHRVSALAYMVLVCLRHLLRGRWRSARIQWDALRRAPELLKA
jgi:GT2 family glycosyltransferase